MKIALMSLLKFFFSSLKLFAFFQPLFKYVLYKSFPTVDLLSGHAHLCMAYLPWA